MFAKRIADAIQKVVPASTQSRGIAAAIQNAIPKASAPAPAPSKSMMPPPQVINRFFQAARGMRLSKGGAVSSGRGDGIAVRGKTKCKMY
jgi:hypothetical protein